MISKRLDKDDEMSKEDLKNEIDFLRFFIITYMISKGLTEFEVIPPNDELNDYSYSKMLLGFNIGILDGCKWMKAILKKMH